MVKYLCQENYQAAANAALKFPPFRTELVKTISCSVKNETKAYSKGKSLAKYDGDPLNLKQFKSEEFLQEASEEMPMAYSIITATSKVCAKYLLNKQALALSAILNTWMPCSNFVYRINALLTAGCCKTEVMDLFHRLGLSSHPNTIRAELQSAADRFDLLKPSSLQSRCLIDLSAVAVRASTGFLPINDLKLFTSAKAWRNAALPFLPVPLRKVSAITNQYK